MKTRIIKSISLVLAFMLVTGLFAPVYTVYADGETQQTTCSQHTWGSWTTTKAATYKESGTKTRTCSVCGKTETSTISKLVCKEHLWGSWTVTKSPTYVYQGSKKRTCKNCGKTETAIIQPKTGKSEWIRENGKSCYLNSEGKFVKGWQLIRTTNKKDAPYKWCYFTQRGVYVTCVSKNTKSKWVKADGRKFYFTSKKKPIGSGFHIIGGKLYYMNSFKAMVVGTFKASDGKTYKTTKYGNITGLPLYIHKYKTFILIDISDQKLKFYKNGVLKRTCKVVTGRKGVTDTPTGIYSIKSKSTNVRLVGSTWNVLVKYWMAFIGSSYGMHDASWRTSGEFNNKTYLKYGSHGCVNMKQADAKYLFNNAPKGTKVIIQK